MKSTDQSRNANQNEKQLIIPFFHDNLIHGKSRLLKEFDTLEWLGKGGFGSVLKVSSHVY